MAKRRTAPRESSITEQTGLRCSESLKAARVDRRTQRTRKALHAALTALIPEKPYDAITVSDILDRADVGRSTFYTHFRDKDDLLVWGIHDMLAGVQPSIARPRTRTERVTWFSRPLFDHIDGHRRDAKMGVDTKARAVVHEHLQEALAELISDAVKKEYRNARRSVSPDLVVRYVASTFILVLRWWLEEAKAASPKDADDIFRALVTPTLEAI